MARSRAFAQVDVFSEQPYLGNPVAVVLDGDGLDDADRQRVARWTNLSETTFVLPPTPGSGADYQVRIVTPAGELPFAGHPTLGTAHAWLEAGGTPQDSALILQECPAGLVPVRREGDLLSFAAPPTRRQGELTEGELQRFLRALGIAPARVVSHQWVDNGPGWAVIRLATAHEVLELAPDLSLIPDGMVGVIGAHPDGSDRAFEMRTFAPRVGVPEDPVCGSMNASVAQWLLRTGEVEGSYRVSQGARVGRAGDVMITCDSAGQVWVGGRTCSLVRGAIVI